MKNIKLFSSGDKNVVNFLKGNLPASLENLGLGDQVYVSMETQESRIFHVHLDDYITEPSYYRKLQGIFGSAGPADYILLHINSGGGNLYTMIQIIGWIQSTEAQTVAVIEGVCASAATLPVMVVDSVIAMPNTMFMAHSASFGSWGPHDRAVRAIDFEDKLLRGVLEDYYKGFFTQEEIDDMIVNAREIYLNPDQVVDRLMKRQEILGAEEEEETEVEALMEKVEEAPKEAAKKKITRRKSTKQDKEIE